ncbi:MAG: hypothetical protein ACK5B3_04830 [Bacteroidota bacterium]
MNHILTQMQKKQRKEIEQQLSITIAYFLKKQHPVAAQGMAKVIKSTAKEISKKFVKEISKAEKTKAPVKKEKKSEVKTPAAKKKTIAKTIKRKKSVRKSAK